VIVIRCQLKSIVYVVSVSTGEYTLGANDNNDEFAVLKYNIGPPVTFTGVAFWVLQKSRTLVYAIGEMVFNLNHNDIE